jgi:hypothetical protein
MMSPFQYVSWFNSVCGYGDLSAAHYNFGRLVSVGNDFMRAAEWWFQSATYGVLAQEHVSRVPKILVDECGRG